jgi:hypothetical protein
VRVLCARRLGRAASGDSLALLREFDREHAGDNRIPQTELAGEPGLNSVGQPEQF